MTQQLVRRFVWTIPVLFTGVTIAFLVLHLIPGDPVNLMMAGRPTTEEVRENERRRLGLDKPLHQQYIHFVTHAVRGDFGNSFRTRQPVVREIKEQFPATLQLAAGAMVFGVTLGIALGVTAGLRPHSPLDGGVMFLALIGISIPVYWVAMILIYVFGLKLGWVPIVGRGWQSLILPCIAVGLWPIGDIARLVRSSILEVRAEDYIRTAHAKGLSSRRVILGHALRNALIPVVTIMGLQLGALLSGGIIVETIFARQGIGMLMVSAILEKDYPVVQAVIVVTTAIYIVANFFVDMLYTVLDPRIRYA
jgi:ABC-type dipeptide/oligopeptide/nickel transport system permease component